MKVQVLQSVMHISTQ